MSEIRLEEIKEWLELPITRELTRRIINLRLDAARNIEQSIADKEYDDAQRFLGLKDAFTDILSLPDRMMEELKDEF